MPQCIEDTTTASHRMFFSLQAYMLLQAIREIGSADGHSESEELTARETAVQTAMHLIAEVPFRLLGDPDISPFYGEVHLSWTQGHKQIVLMCLPNQTALIHHYLRVPGAPSVHDIEEAVPDNIANWLRWLRD